MKCLVALAAGLVLACGCSFSPEHRVDLVVRNTSPRSVTLRASTRIFSKRIVLKPGETWSGWLDRRFVGRDVLIAVEEEPAD